MTSGASRLKAKLSRTKQHSQVQPAFTTFTSSSSNNRLRRRGRTTGAIATTATNPSSIALNENIAQTDSCQQNQFQNWLSKDKVACPLDSFPKVASQSPTKRQISSIDMPNASNRQMKMFKTEVHESHNASQYTNKNSFCDQVINYAQNMEFSKNNNEFEACQFQQCILPRTGKSENEFFDIKKQSSSITTQLGVFSHIYTATQVLDNCSMNDVNYTCPLLKNERSSMIKSLANKNLQKDFGSNFIEQTQGNGPLFEYDASKNFPSENKEYYNYDGNNMKTVVSEPISCGISKFKNANLKEKIQKSSQCTEPNYLHENISAKHMHHATLDSQREDPPDLSNSYQNLRYFNNGFEVDIDGIPLETFNTDRSCNGEKIDVAPVSKRRIKDYVLVKQNTCETYSKMIVSTEIKSKIIQNHPFHKNQNSLDVENRYDLSNPVLDMDQVETTVQSLEDENENNEDLKLISSLDITNTSEPLIREYSDVVNLKFKSSIQSNKMVLAGKKMTRKPNGHDVECRVTKKHEKKLRNHSTKEDSTKQKKLSKGMKRNASDIINSEATMKNNKTNKKYSSLQGREKYINLFSSKRKEGPHTALIDELFGPGAGSSQCKEKLEDDERIFKPSNDLELNAAAILVIMHDTVH